MINRNSLFNKQKFTYLGDSVVEEEPEIGVLETYFVEIDVVEIDLHLLGGDRRLVEKFVCIKD
jgi:hypothetical protein